MLPMHAYIRICICAKDGYLFNFLSSQIVFLVQVVQCYCSSTLRFPAEGTHAAVTLAGLCGILHHVMTMFFTGGTPPIFWSARRSSEVRPPQLTWPRRFAGGGQHVGSVEDSVSIKRRFSGRPLFARTRSCSQTGARRGAACSSRGGVLLLAELCLRLGGHLSARAVSVLPDLRIVH